MLPSWKGVEGKETRRRGWGAGGSVWVRWYIATVTVKDAWSLNLGCSIGPEEQEKDPGYLWNPMTIPNLYGGFKNLQNWGDLQISGFCDCEKIESFGQDGALGICHRPCRPRILPTLHESPLHNTPKPSSTPPAQPENKTNFVLHHTYFSNHHTLPELKNKTKQNHSHFPLSH